MHGCDRRRAKPRQIGPFELYRCPNYILGQPDGFRDDVVQAYNAIEDGIITGWPDQFSGALVDGVRYLKAERIHAQNEEQARAQRERERQQKQRRTGGRY